MSTANADLVPAFEWGLLQEITITPLIVRTGLVSDIGRSRTSTHPFYTWWWIERGHVSLDCAGKSLRISPGQWVLIPEGQRRRQQFSSHAELLSINLDVRWASGLPVLVLDEPLTGSASSLPALRQVAESICTRMAGDSVAHRLGMHRQLLPIWEGLDLRAELNHFVRILFEYAVSQGARLGLDTGLDPRLQLVLSSLRDTVRAGPLPYRQWQEEAGLGRIQLDRLARAQLHRSLRQHRDELLVAEACRRLASASTPVKRIAAELGFVDTAHFCRWMKRHTGHTPVELRQPGA